MNGACQNLSMLMRKECVPVIVSDYMNWNELLKMGMDLDSPKAGYFRWNVFGWKDILNTMVAFGWNPQGAIATEYISENPEDDGIITRPETPERRISYSSNDYQWVDDEDAKGMLEATQKLIDAMDKLQEVDVGAEGVGETKVIESEDDLVDVFDSVSSAWEDMLRPGAKTPDLQSWLKEYDYVLQWRDYLQHIVDTKSYFSIG